MRAFLLGGSGRWMQRTGRRRSRTAFDQDAAEFAREGLVKSKPDQAKLPFVTVVIPTRDRWSLLETTLETALAQEDVELEVIVVDDGSRRPIPRATQPWSDPRVRCVRHSRPAGVATARNAGIAAARGRWLAFLDDDDIWSPHKLARQISRAEDIGSLFAYAGAVVIHEDGARLELASPPPARRLRGYLRSYNAIPAGASNVIADLDLVRRLGGFDPSLNHFADWDLWIRLADTAPAAVCPEPLVGYRLHPHSMRSTAPGVLGELRYLDAKHHAKAAQPDRVWVYLWLAEGRLLAGRRLAAASICLAGALRYRSRTCLGVARTMWTTGRQPGAAAATTVDAGNLPWLESRLSDHVSRAPVIGPRRYGREMRRRVSEASRMGVARDLLRVLERTSLKAGLALTYHEIGADRGEPCAKIVPVVDEALFAHQLDHLQASFFPVFAGELRQTAMRRRRGQRFPVALTFDDDLRSHVEVAGPMVASAGIRATFFLTGASLDGPASFWWERLQRALDRGLKIELDPVDKPSVDRRPPLAAQDLATMVQALEPEARDALSASWLDRLGGEDPQSGLQGCHVAELVRAGLQIGFHTKGHLVLTSLSDTALEHALRDGREALESASGSEVTLIAYPHGEADDRVATAARNAGFRAGFTTSGVAVSRATSPQLMGRVYPSGVSVGHFAFQLAIALLKCDLRRRHHAAPSPAR
jgi:peptidoglycan/xylan/chitin deacetylase (PgdA/CDA1 family)/GT2 family glycosyltransferase